ncbi:hypothetical protein HaLaN_16477 [Haematococcus lacustris]|uniref:Uncharacterized protein n=1 Tax=Haematococcus lacustris TaxID=44745 RepID=A0A699ZE17_HAELA|nr:hypothetical protein HaLaN_16477 [Haematococcus lacustris]
MSVIAIDHAFGQTKKRLVCSKVSLAGVAGRDTKHQRTGNQQGRTGEGARCLHNRLGPGLSHESGRSGQIGDNQEDQASRGWCQGVRVEQHWCAGCQDELRDGPAAGLQFKQRVEAGCAVMGLRSWAATPGLLCHHTTTVAKAAATAAGGGATASSLSMAN